MKPPKEEFEEDFCKGLLPLMLLLGGIWRGDGGGLYRPRPSCRRDDEKLACMLRNQVSKGTSV